MTFCAVRCQNSRKFRFHCVNEIFDFSNFFSKNVKNRKVSNSVLEIQFNVKSRPISIWKMKKIGQFWFLKEHKSVKVGLIHWFNHRATSWPPFDPPELLNIQFTSISSFFSFNPKFEHFWNYPSVQWAQKPKFFLKITVYFQSPKIRGNLGARASMLFFFQFSAGSTSYDSSPNDRFFFLESDAI